MREEQAEAASGLPAPGGTVHCFNTVSRIVHGRGCVAGLAEAIRAMGCGRAVLVADAGLAATGLVAGVRNRLTAGGVAVVHGIDVTPEPASAAVEAAAAAARGKAPDLVVGLGGGSSLDFAKAVSARLGNDGPVEGYLGQGNIPRPGLPLVLVPTTAGTGSEATSIAVLVDSRDGMKRGMVSPHLHARAVFLDPELTLGLPPGLTATTGLDALVHAVESFIGRQATPFTDAVNEAAIRMIAANLPRAHADGGDLAAREQMLYASCLAGIGFSNTQVGLVHAIGMAAGGLFHLPHGAIIAAVCPFALAYNAPAAPEKFARIAAAFGRDVVGLSAAEAAKRGVSAIRDLVVSLGIATRLSAYGVTRDAFGVIADDVAGATRFLQNNPRAVTREDVLTLLEENV